VEPSQQAVDWANAWDRDPRQVEVVLREARPTLARAFAPVPLTPLP